MRICLFSSYFTGSALPVYLRYWLEQLQPHFDRIVLLSNDDKQLAAAELSWLAAQGVEYRPVRNEGFDFGMWQKALATLDIATVDRLALANDSCILFAPLDDFFAWFDRSGLDVGGMLESQAFTRHLQSFFLVFNARAAHVASEYILAHPVSGVGYDRIVDTFELGLSRRFYGDPAFRVGARYTPQPRHALDDPSYFFIDSLLRAGMPLVKKKMLNRQGPGGAVRRLVLEGIDPEPVARVRLIQQLHGLDDARAAALFGPALAAGEPQRKRFRRRLLRYRLERLLRVLTGTAPRPPE